MAFVLNTSTGVSLYWGGLASLIEALRYQTEGHVFDSRCCHWKSSL